MQNEAHGSPAGHRTDDAAVVASADVAKLERAFVDAVRAAKADDPVAPVLVVVGSHLQHIYLRRLLARSLTAVANIRFVTLLDVAGELALPSDAGTEAGARPALPLPDGAHIPLLEQVITEQRTGSRGNPAYGVADAGMVHAVAATVRDLREGGIGAAQVASASARPWMQMLATIAAAYRTALGPFADTTRRAEEAAAAPPAQAAAAVQRCAAGSRQILVYGIYDVNALQLGMLDLLVQALAARLFLPCSTAGEAFTFVRQTVDRMRRRGVQVEALDDGTAERGPRAARAVFSCADRQAETEETVRRVLEDLADGVPAAEIAILHRMDPVYDEMICGVLDRAGVPHYRSAGHPVRRSPVGRAALNLLQLLYAEPRRGPLLELLSLPGIDLTWIDSPAPDTRLTPRPARWEALSKELGLVKGWDEFRRGAELPRATRLARRRRRTHRGSGRGHARVARRGPQSGRCRPPGAGRGNVAGTCRPVRRPAAAPPAAGRPARLRYQQSTTASASWRCSTRRPPPAAPFPPPRRDSCRPPRPRFARRSCAAATSSAAACSSAT